jgi:transcriptional regulator with XRE-family HTH domain
VENVLQFVKQTSDRSGLTMSTSPAKVSGVSRFYAEFGRRLREARDEAGLSQRELAERLGLTRGSVANVEAGRQGLALHVFNRACEVLTVSPERLLPPPEPLVDQKLIDGGVNKLLRELPGRWVGERERPASP